jgi:hypothetical protein
MPSVIRTVLHALGPDARSRLAAELDEPVERIDAALPVAVAAVLQGLIAASATPAGSAEVLSAVRDARRSAGNDPLEGDAPRLRVLAGLSLPQRLSAAASVKPPSAVRLIECSTLGTLAAVAASGVATDEDGLRSFLRTQETEAMRLAPEPAAPLGLAGPSLDVDPPGPAPRPALLKFAIALLAVLALLIWWLRF